MTAEELIAHFNKTYGLSKWPSTYTVDPVTYANCCEYVFNLIVASGVGIDFGGFTNVVIYLGTINNGLMFRNVELVLKHE